MSASSNSPQDTHYLNYHLRLLRDFVRQTQQLPPFVLDECSEEDREFLERLEALPDLSEQDDFLFEGQQLINRVVASYPHLMPLLHRDLLWFFGGDCLHYMPDDEIARYQELDERRHEAAATGEPFSYENERAKIFGLH